MEVEYFEFYRGNLISGFDYFYGKKTAQTAFILGVDRQKHLAPLDLADPAVNFDSKQLATGLDKYKQFVRPVAFQWEGITSRLVELVDDWQPNYQGPVDEANEEWGLRLKYQNVAEMQHSWGLNQYPKNFDDFYQWLKTLTSGHL